MKLYPIPGGTWAGTEADWKKQCKALGIDHKQLRGAREVPTAKGDLLEFLNFNAVDVYRTGGSTTVSQPAGPDLEQLRALHNPDGVRPSALAAATPTDSTADVQLSRMENAEGDLDIDAVVEFATNASGYVLKRIAGAVAAAFSRLAA